MSSVKDLINSAGEIIANNWWTKYPKEQKQIIEQYGENLKQYFVKHGYNATYMGKQIHFDVPASLSLKYNFIEMADADGLYDYDTKTIYLSNKYKNNFFRLFSPTNDRHKNEQVDLLYLIPHEITHAIQNYLIENKNQFHSKSIEHRYLSELSANIKCEEFQENFTNKLISLHFNQIRKSEDTPTLIYRLSLSERTAFSNGLIFGQYLSRKFNVTRRDPYPDIERDTKLFSAHYDLAIDKAMLAYDLTFSDLLNHVRPANYAEAKIMYEMVEIGHCLFEINSINNKTIKKNEIVASAYRNAFLNNEEKELAALGFQPNRMGIIDHSENSLLYIQNIELFNTLTLREQRQNPWTVLRAYQDGTIKQIHPKVLSTIQEYLGSSENRFCKEETESLAERLNIDIVPVPDIQYIWPEDIQSDNGPELGINWE